jgi:hypothetical protein
LRQSDYLRIALMPQAIFEEKVPAAADSGPFIRSDNLSGHERLGESWMDEY